MLLSGHGVVKGLASASLGGALSSVLTLVSGLFSPKGLLRLESNIHSTLLNNSFFILLSWHYFPSIIVSYLLYVCIYLDLILPQGIQDH